MQYLNMAMMHYFDFNGRNTRTEFWMYYLFYFICIIVLTIIETMLGFPVLSAIFGLAFLIPTLSFTCRRLHDTDKSGWWQLIGIIPVIGWIILIILLVQESDGDNRFGPGPSERVSDIFE